MLLPMSKRLLWGSSSTEGAEVLASCSIARTLAVEALVSLSRSAKSLVYVSIGEDLTSSSTPGGVVNVASGVAGMGVGDGSTISLGAGFGSTVGIGIGTTVSSAAPGSDSFGISTSGVKSGMPFSCRAFMSVSNVRIYLVGAP